MTCSLFNTEGDAPREILISIDVRPRPGAVLPNDDDRRHISLSCRRGYVLQCIVGVHTTMCRGRKRPQGCLDSDGRTIEVIFATCVRPAPSVI